MCYAAYKLWNVCNYERNNYKNLGLEKYPDWYDQKSKHKDDLWFKSLPSQTAQEICKLLDKSWKSFYQLKESGGIENPGTPRYKKDKMPITYMQKGIQHENGSYNVRLSLPKKLKEYMAHTYDIRAAYLYLKNRNCSVGLRIHCADRTKTWACRQKSYCRRQFSMDFCS